MATSSLIDDISVELLVCRICLEQFRRPKTLSCRHTFCEECLEKLRDAEEDDEDDILVSRRTSRRRTAARLTCPVCNARSVIPPGGVRRLPDDPVMARLSDVVERRRSTSASRPSASAGSGSAASMMWCDICSTAASSGSKRRRTAESRCLECAKLLCSACVRLHRRTNVTSGHSLIDLETDVSTTCRQHGPDEQLRFYCETCDSCVCVLCTYDPLHAGHDVLSFAEAIHSQRGPLVARVEHCRDRLERVRSRLQVVEAIDDDLRKAEDGIREAAMETVTYVRRRERELLSALKASVSLDHQGNHGEPVIANGGGSGSGSGSGGGGGGGLTAQRRSLAEEARQLSSVVESAERLLEGVGADGRGAAPFLLARRQLVDSIDGLLPQSSTAESAAAVVVEDSRLPAQRISFVPFGVESTFAVSLGQISVRSADNIRVDGRMNVDECSSSKTSLLTHPFLPPIAQLPPSRPKPVSSRGAELTTPSGIAVEVESSGTTPMKTQAVVVVQEEIHRVHAPPHLPHSASRTVEMQENEIWIDVYFEDASVQTDDTVLTSTNGGGNRCEASGGSPSLSTSRRQSLTTSRNGTAGQEAAGSSPTTVRRRLLAEQREVVAVDGVGCGTDPVAVAAEPLSSDASRSTAGAAETSKNFTGTTSTSSSSPSTPTRKDQATDTKGLIFTRDDWTWTFPPRVVSTGTYAEVRTTRSRSVDAMPLPPPPVTRCAATMTDAVGTNVDKTMERRRSANVYAARGPGENVKNVDDGGENEKDCRQSDVITAPEVQQPSSVSTSTILTRAEGQPAADVTDVGKTEPLTSLADSQLHLSRPTSTDSQSVQQSVTPQQAEAVQPVAQLLALLPEIARTADVLAASHFSSGLTAVLLRDVAAIGLRLAASFARNSRDVATDTGDDTRADVSGDKVVQQRGGGVGTLLRSLSAGSSQLKTQPGDGRRLPVVVSTASKAIQTQLPTPKMVVDRGCGEATAIVADQSTSTPPAPAVFDKETSTSSRHQIHKSVATDSQSTADKQTWMAIDVASAYLNSMATTRRSVTVSRGTNTLPFLVAPAPAPRAWLPTVDRASSPIRPAVADKAVTANRAEALEPLDTFPSSVNPAGVPPGSPRGRRTPLSLSPRSKLACISESAEHCRDEQGDADESCGTTHELPPLSSINSRLMTRSLNRLPNRDVEALLHGRPSTPRSAGGLHNHHHQQQQQQQHHHPLAMSTSSSLPILRSVPLNRNVFDFENLLNVRAGVGGRLGSSGAGGEEPAAGVGRREGPSLPSSSSPAAPPPSPPSVQEREDSRQMATGVARSAPVTPTGYGINCELLSAMLTDLSRDRAVAPSDECDGTNSPMSHRSTSSN